MKWITRASANQILLVSRSSRAAEGGKQCKQRLSCDSKLLANQRRLFPRLRLCVWSQHCSGSKPIVRRQVFVNKTNLMSAHDPDIFPRLMNKNGSHHACRTVRDKYSPSQHIRRSSWEEQILKGLTIWPLNASTAHFTLGKFSLREGR